MLTIQIKNGANEVIAVINDIYSLSVDDEVNKGGKLKLRFPTEKWLQKKPLQKGYRISVVYGEKIGQVVRLFEGYITDVTLKTQEVQIEADNRLSYLQYRMIKSLKKYIQAPISTVISDVFNTLNATHELPITLGLNDCDTTITKDFEIGTSFYDILKFCREAEPKLVVRVLNVNNYNFLEVSKNAGKVLDGVREYDAKYTRGTNIVDWSRKDSMDEFYSNVKTATGEVINQEFINRTNLLFEKYEEEGAPALPSGIAIPSIAVSRETDRRDFNIWDRKNIRLLTWYERLPLQYQGLIQSRKVNINAGTGIKAEIKISEDYKSDTNILDLVLQNLRGRKPGSGSAPDMSDYYTKEQTAVVINTAIAGKADIAHTHLVNQITDFASAVSSMITTALADYVTTSDLSTTLAYYSQIGHTHTTDDITNFTTAVNALIAEGISGKADVNHRHTVADISDLDDTLADYVTLTALNTALADYVTSTGLSTALADYTTTSDLNTLLAWKANAAHSHAISDVTGLQTALDGKASSTHSHAINDVTGLQDALNSKANSSDVYTKNQTYSKTEVDNELADKADADDVYTKTETDTLLGGKANTSHSHAISDVTGLQTALDGKSNTGHGHSISDVTNLQTTLDAKADKSEVRVYTITESMVTVTTDSTKGVDPYNTSYGYTNITINANAWVERKEGALYDFVISSSLVVASAYRNVRVRIGTGAYIPMKNWGNTILAGSSYMVKGRTDLYEYKTTYEANGALHLNAGSDTTYSAMSVAEGKAGTATNARTVRADYLKQIIQYYIPTALSAFTNDTNFITNAVNDLVNYYKKTETYTKSEVNDLISGITWITVEVVQTLPATGQNGVFYLVPNSGTSPNVYDEYIRVASTSSFEKLGTTEIDLSNYVQKTDTLLTINGVAYTQGQSLTTPNTTYETLTANEISTGTATIGKLISAKLLKDAIDDAISGKADTVHTHAISDVTGLQTALDGKANSTHSHAISDVTGLQTALDGKASSVHSHAIADVTGLQSALDAKAVPSDIKNSTITFKINSTAFTGNTFTLNQSSNKTIDLPITKSTVGLGNVDNTADADKNVAYATNAGKVNNHTVNKDVPSDAKFTDTTYEKADANNDGLMSKEHYSKLEGIESGAQVNKVTWVKGSAENSYREGNVNITKANIGLGNVDNTADTAKPVSTAQKTYIDTEVAKKYDKLVEVTVSTWASTAAKVGTTTGGNYVPSTWDLILVNFVNGCNVSSPTLNIDGSGAKNIRVGNANADANTFGLGSTSSSNVKALFIYDGTYYRTFSIKNTTYTISDHKITLVQDGVELGYFTLNQNTDKTISRTSSGDEGQINATIVQNMIDIALGNYDNVFKTNSGLYKILNAIDEDDVLGLTEGETWSDIINNSASMNLISHSYACMVDVSNSEYAMEALMEVSGAVDQVSQCRDSIYIIANNDKSADIYLGSATGIQYLFTYQQAQDAFFTNDTRKQEIINDNIMVIVNSNTLLQSLYTDSVVAQAIAWNQTALNTIASSSTKLGIVDDSNTIMDAIATNSGALGNMSDADFTTYILENTTYLTLTTSATAGQNRINAMDADDLLPAIFYYTGLSGYSTFADLAANDWAINIVQSNQYCMLIIDCNDEALDYFGYRPTSNTQAYFDLKTDFTDKSGNNRDATVNWRSITSKGRAYSSISNSTFTFNCPWVATRTIAVWVKYNGGSASSRRNISWVGGQSNGYYHGLFISNTSRRDLTVKDGMDAISGTNIDNNRHLLVGTYSSGNSKLYLDTNLIATNTNGIGTGNNTGYMFSKWGNEAFIWYVGEIIIEEGNRTQAQIIEYYNKVKKNYTN